jgi:hypothetical protein
VEATAVPTYEAIFDVIGFRMPQIEASSLEIYVLGGGLRDPQAR